MSHFMGQAPSQVSITKQFIKRAKGHCMHNETASVVYWSEFLATDPEVLGSIPALPDFLTSSGSGTGSTLPCEYN
jgi:hypothetical protein